MPLDRKGLGCYILMKARRIEKEMLKKIHKSLKCYTPKLFPGSEGGAAGVESKCLK